MPELPEVEAARRAIEEHCVGKKIKRSIVADDDKVIDAGGLSPSDFQASLTGKTIVAACRKGKNMWLVLDSPPFPSFQFGMAGAIYIKGVAVTKYQRSMVNDTDEWPSKYSKVFIELDDGLEFSFTDKRRFAKVRLLEDPESVPPISELGPDALTEPMQVDEFVESMSKKKIAIKALLLDQSYLAGIGNWIADEVLYQARIHPLQIASSLSKEQTETLHRCIKEVVQLAVEVDADCTHFPVEWLFHFRWGKKAGKVNGKILHLDISDWCYRSLKKHWMLEQMVVSFPVTGFSIPAKRNLGRHLSMVWLLTFGDCHAWQGILLQFELMLLFFFIFFLKSELTVSDMSLVFLVHAFLIIPKCFFNDLRLVAGEARGETPTGQRSFSDL